MSTPTCRTCDAKFPGKAVCKRCGADPNAEPTLDYKIERAKAKPKVAPADALWHPAKRVSLRSVARAFGVPTPLILDPERLRKERGRQRAHVRSLRNTKTSARSYKHGRTGVR